MVNVAPLQELLQAFLQNEHRDLYAIGGVVAAYAVSWARANLRWSPRLLFGHTRKAWQHLGREVNGDATTKILCTAAPVLADLVVLVFQILGGIKRVPTASQDLKDLRMLLLTLNEQQKAYARSLNEKIAKGGAAELSAASENRLEQIAAKAERTAKAVASNIATALIKEAAERSGKEVTEITEPLLLRQAVLEQTVAELESLYVGLDSELLSCKSKLNTPRTEGSSEKDTLRIYQSALKPLRENHGGC